MKKLILFLSLFLIVPVGVWALMSPGMGGQTVPSGGFCTGGEAFCEDFEGVDVTWDATNKVDNCAGYDADGDFCDDDTTTYKNGSEALGLRGSFTYYVREGFTTLTEFYIEYWWRCTDVTNVHGLTIWENTRTTKVIKHYNDADSIVIQTNNANQNKDTNTQIAVNTWGHIGVYYKEETAISSNDGIVRVWIDTDGTFDAVDLKVNDTNVDTGQVDAELLEIQGPGNGMIVYYDDMKIVSGEPSWPTS